MSALRALVASAVAVVAAGCPSRASSDYTSADGPIPVVITNYSSEKLCHVNLSPSTTKMHHVTDMYLESGTSGETKWLLPGQTVVAHVKAGYYQIHGESCGFRQLTDQQMTEFEIQGPTAVGFNQPEATAPADYKRIQLNVHYPVESEGAQKEREEHEAHCLPSGRFCGLDQSRCCSGRSSCPNGHCDEATCL